MTMVGLPINLVDDIWPKEVRPKLSDAPIQVLGIEFAGELFLK